MTNHRWNSLPAPGSGEPSAPLLPGEVWVIVVAGGSGSRFGGLKQFELLAGERVIDWSIAAASFCADGVVAVVSADSDLALTRGELQVHPKIRAVVHGGASRSASVRNGLAAVPDSAAIIVVHDAARPLASPQLFTDSVQAIRNGAGAAVTAVPVVDTIKRTDGSLVDGTVDRADLVAVQTPQAFNAALLRLAHAEGSDATDDAGLVEALGANVVIVPGDVRNLKLTTPEDLIILEAFATQPTQILGATLGGRVTQAGSGFPTNVPLGNLGNLAKNTVRTSGSLGSLGSLGNENFAADRGDSK